MKRFIRLFAALPLGLLLVCGAVPAWAASVVSDSPGPVFISYPSAIGDGQAFTFSVSVPLEVEKMQVLWRGKHFALPLEKHASGRFRVGYCLLAVPLDETGAFPVSVRFPKKTAPTLRVADVVAEFERVLQDGNQVQVEDLPLSPVRIVPRPYPVQKLTVPPKYVAPPASEQARIERDRKEMNAALGHFTPELYWKPANGAFTLASPGTTQIPSYFGSLRVFNNPPRSPHTAHDLDPVAGHAS